MNKKTDFLTESETASPAHAHPAIEADLLAMFTSRQPDAEFAARLEAELLKRAAAARSASPKDQKPRWRQILNMKPLLTASLIVIVLILAVVTAIGPQRVLAAVQNLLGYVPGIGFVDLEGARMLASPVSMTKEGITLELEQVVASREETTVAFRLRVADVLSNESAATDASDPGAILDLSGGFQPTLVLPDGERIPLTRMRYSGSDCCWKGMIHFPPIPAEASQAWLEFDLASDDTAGRASRLWKVPFTLHDATEVRLSDEQMETIIPDNARATVNGVTVEVLQVVRAAGETALQLQVSWEQTGWSYWSGIYPLLRDDVGHTYYEMPPGETTAGSGETYVEEAVEVLEGTAVDELGDEILGRLLPSPSTATETHIFPPLSAAARQITVVLNELEFSVPVDASFFIDFGDHPQPGQIFPIDQQVEVAGQQVSITSARLIENKFPAEDSNAASPYHLEILFSPEEIASQTLISLMVESGTLNKLNILGSMGSCCQPLSMSIDINKLPAGVVNFRISQAAINLKGPWEIPIDLPVNASPPVKIQHIHPGVSETMNGVTIAIEEVTLTDRVTRVRIAQPDLPDGAGLISTYSWYTKEAPFIEDSAGNRLDLPRAISWTIPPSFDPGELVFASLGSLPGREGRFEQTGRLTLNLPSVTIFYPGKATLEVDVPAQVEFHPETVVEKSMEGESYEFTRWLSDPWAIDLPVEIAGHSLRFYQARLEWDANRIPQGYRLELTAEPPIESAGRPRLFNLHAASIGRPDGEVQRIEYALPETMFSYLAESYIGPAGPDTDERVAYLRVDITNPDSFGYLAGKYHIELDGAAVLVPGPWQLTW